MNLPGHRPKALWISSLVTLAAVGAAARADNDRSDAAEVARRMIEAERRLTSIDVRYVVDVPVGPGERLRQAERYLRKLMDAATLELHDFEYVLHRDGRMPRRVVSRIESFDGSRVMVLDRGKNYGLRSGMTSTAAADRDRTLKQGNIHARVWGFGGPPYGEWVLQDDCDVRVAGKESLAGVETVVLVGSVSNNQGGLKLWVAPSRGYLPLRAEITAADASAPFTVTELRDLKEVAPGVWYPYEVRAGKPGAEPLDDDAVIRYRVEDLSLRPLDKGDFRIAFPLGTQVTDRDSGKSFTSTGSGGERGVGAAQAWAAVAAMGAAFILIVWLLARSRRRRRTSMGVGEQTAGRL